MLILVCDSTASSISIVVGWEFRCALRSESHFARLL